jgi:hypothetical protein
MENFEIAREYFQYRIEQGWGLLRIAQEHGIPAPYSSCYSEPHIIDWLARYHEQIRNR